MKILEPVRILFKKKNLTKAEKNFRRTTVLINLLALFYLVFILSNLIHAIMVKNWIYAPLQLIFVIFLLIFWLHYAKKYLKNEKKLLAMKSLFVTEIYSLKSNEVKDWSLEAKATFVEYICSQQDDNFTQCVEALLEHYDKTKNENNNSRKQNV